ncbi:DMT family transporter, partial [Patescibacteria group bacterium]|nr:DMT family transporter [Patescibacteria group bacterium]MBU1702906.1 DMT family transporter [Patescibacteria group bacterium]
MPLPKTCQGELYIYAESLLWSLFPIFSIIAFASLPPLYTGAISTLIATGFFAFIMTIKKKWHELTIKSAWKDILLATLIVGILFYSLIFIGLQKTTAGSAGIILLMEVFFSMFILRIWNKEHLAKSNVYGSILMVIGAIIILFPGRINLNEGDAIILLATAIPPVGNYFAQQARAKVSSHTIMFVRSALSGIFILLLAMIFEPAPSSANLTTSFIFLLVNGLLLMGLSKVFWLESIHRIPITKALALHSISPAFTLTFAFFILGEIPTIWQILGLLPMILGVMFLTGYNLKNRRNP